MLYELAWVYVRLGDVQRAERALEVLRSRTRTARTSATATLLRADLLLRAGAFDKRSSSTTACSRSTSRCARRSRGSSTRTKDVSVYYEKLSQQQLDVLDQNEQLPPLAVRWAREAEDGPMAFAVIDDVNQCKKLIRQSNLLIDKLTASSTRRTASGRSPSSRRARRRRSR